MDVYCTKCGEPWDMESIHDEVEMRFIDKPRPWMIPNNDLPDGVYELKHDQTIYEKCLNEVKNDFVRRGCVALGGDVEWCNSHSRKPNSRAEISALAFELMGNDIDGVASEMDDAEYFGLFDD